MRGVLLALTATCFCRGLFAQSAAPATMPAATTQASMDMLTGPVDPYDQPSERAAFLKAAGVDGELTVEEFQAAAKAGKGFVRKYDSWLGLIEFDKNESDAIDWVEAEAYRLDLRQRLLDAFDADNDGKLTGKERQAAVAALTGGKIPLAHELAPATQGAFSAPNRILKAADGPARRMFLQRYGGLPDFKQFVKAYDKNGDGVVAEEEIRQADRDRQTAMRVYDADGDGVLSPRELRAARIDLMAAQQRLMLERYDINHNGLIDPSEQVACNKDAQEQLSLIKAARRHEPSATTRNAKP